MDMSTIFEKEKRNFIQWRELEGVSLWAESCNNPLGQGVACAKRPMKGAFSSQHQHLYLWVCLHMEDVRNPSGESTSFTDLAPSLVLEIPNEEMNSETPPPPSTKNRLVSCVKTKNTIIISWMIYLVTVNTFICVVTLRCRQFPS